jgi:hypothetical protein
MEPSGSQKRVQAFTIDSILGRSDRFTTSPKTSDCSDVFLLEDSDSSDTIIHCRSNDRDQPHPLSDGADKHSPIDYPAIPSGPNCSWLGLDYSAYLGCWNNLKPNFLTLQGRHPTCHVFL